MKNSMLFLLFNALILNALAQSRFTTTRHGDTVINTRTDTLNKFINKRKDYTKRADIVTSFSVHFVKNVVSPGNTNHPVYIQYMSNGIKLKETAKSKLIESLKKNPGTIKWSKFKNVEEINSCTLIVLPVYFLTHNVANLTNETNLAPFFSLDTSNITYKVMKNNTVMAIIKFQKGATYFRNFNSRDSLEYYKIISMHREPIAFIRQITDEQARLNTSYDGFGYFNKGHIIFVFGNQGIYTTQNGKTVSKEFYKKEYSIQSAEAYYLGSDSTLANLNHFISNEDKSLKQRQKQ